MKYRLASDTWNAAEYRAALEVLASGHFTMGDKVQEFEKAYASWQGSKFAVYCNSGSSANLLALSALYYDPRHLNSLHKKKVVVPAVSWSTTYMPIVQLGFELEFIDVEATTFNLNPEHLKALDPSEIFAVFAVNLLGVPCNYDEIKAWCLKHQIYLLEDNCESMGASVGGRKTGTFGAIGTQSTFYSHHMATMEGGICTTDDELTYEILKSLRAHGWTRNVENHELFYSHFTKPESALQEKFHFVLPGYNFRPTEMQAAIGKEQTKKLDEFIGNRIRNYSYFAQKLQEVEFLSMQSTYGEPSWFGFGLLVDDLVNRDDFAQFLVENGVETRPIVSGNMLRQPVFGRTDQAKHYRVAERIHNKGLMVGNHQQPIHEEIDHFFAICDAYRC